LISSIASWLSCWMARIKFISRLVRTGAGTIA
jgi:hypothetical protein